MPCEHNSRRFWASSISILVILVTNLSIMSKSLFKVTLFPLRGICRVYVFCLEKMLLAVQIPPRELQIPDPNDSWDKLKIHPIYIFSINFVKDRILKSFHFCFTFFPKLISSHLPPSQSKKQNKIFLWASDKALSNNITMLML